MGQGTIRSDRATQWRQSTQALRQGPEKRGTWIVDVDGVGRWLDAEACESATPMQISMILAGPSDSAILASAPRAERAWGVDEFQRNISAAWMSCAIDVTIVAFGLDVIGEALLAALPKVWRITLLTDGVDWVGTARIDRLLSSAIGEIIVYPAGLGDVAVNSRVMNVVREIVTLRDARGQTLPTVRCRVSRNNASAEDVRLWVRQVGADGFEMFDRNDERQRIMQTV